MDVFPKQGPGMNALSSNQNRLTIRQIHFCKTSTVDTDTCEVPKSRLPIKFGNFQSA